MGGNFVPIKSGWKEEQFSFLPWPVWSFCDKLLLKNCVETFSHSVMSNSLWPHGLQPARLLCPRNFPGKNMGVGCHSLLQGIFLIHGVNLCLLHWQADSLPLSHQVSPYVIKPTLYFWGYEFEKPVPLKSQFQREQFRKLQADVNGKYSPAPSLLKINEDSLHRLPTAQSIGILISIQLLSMWNPWGRLKSLNTLIKYFPSTLHSFIPSPIWLFFGETPLKKKKKKNISQTPLQLTVEEPTLAFNT